MTVDLLYIKDGRSFTVDESLGFNKAEFFLIVDELSGKPVQTEQTLLGHAPINRVQI